MGLLSGIRQNSGISFDSQVDAKFEITVPPEMQQGMTSGGQLAPRVSRAVALQVPAVLRSRNLICSTLARLPMHIRDKERRIATPTTLLEQINPDIPNVVTYSETYEDLLFESVSWWRILDRGFHGYPTFAEHIGVDRVHISGIDLPTLNGHGMVYGPTRIYIDGLPVREEDVIRFDSPNPPLLKHAARAIRACLNLDITASNYAETPVPLGAFTPKEGARPREDPKTIQEILDKWDMARRSRSWAFIGAAWELKELQFNAEQIQLAEQRQHAVLEIARAAGIDPEDLGISTTSRTYQNAEQRRLDLLDFTLSAYSSAVEQRLSMGDVTPRGYYAKVNFDGFLRSDTKTRFEAHEIALKNGFETIPEVRELEDRPDLTPAQRAATTPPIDITAQRSNGEVTSNPVAR